MWGPLTEDFYKIVFCCILGRPSVSWHQQLNADVPMIYCSWSVRLFTEGYIRMNRRIPASVNCADIHYHCLKSYIIVDPNQVMYTFTLFEKLYDRGAKLLTLSKSFTICNIVYSNLGISIEIKHIFDSIPTKYVGMTSIWVCPTPDRLIGWNSNTMDHELAVIQ